MSSPDDHPLDLLPFHVNGTLDAAERQRVVAHLAACEACREELALLEALKAGVRAADAGSPPLEMGWQRLARDMRADGRRRSGRGWLKLALAASLLVVVVQTGLLVQRHGAEPGYRPAGVTETGVVLQVRFRPQASEAEMRALLQSIGGRIVDGPGALGIYRVRLAEGRDAAAVLKQLQGRPELVEHVARD